MQPDRGQIRLDLAQGGDIGIESESRPGSSPLKLWLK
jgi:hypothetical protein